MANDRLIGGAIFGGSIIGVVIYGLLIYLWPIQVLEVSAFLAVLLVLGILAWIGYTMATTPPPEPIAEIPDVGDSSQGAPAKTEQKETK